jgi:MATE family multidrug resistance protein
MSTAEARTLVALAWPVVLTQLGQMGMGVVDVFMVGHLGEDPLGAVALGNLWSFASLVFLIGVMSGLDPLLSHPFGAEDPKGAGRALVRGAVVTAALAIPVALVHVLAGPGLWLLGQPTVLIPDASAYAMVIALSIPAFVAFGLLRRFLQAQGRMLAPAIAIGVGTVVNVPADYALIHGVWGMPELGVVGVAWATVLVRYAIVAVIALIAWSSLRETWPGLSGTLSWPALRRVAAISVPVGLQTASESWSFGVALLMMGWLGKTAVAGHAVAMQFATMAFMVPLGLSVATATRVGNLMGAGRDWRRAGWVALGLALVLTSISASVLLLFPEALASTFTDERPVIAVAVTLIPLSGAFQLFDGFQVVAFGVLRGAGDTRWPSIANLIGYWLVGLPAGYVLAFPLGLGPAGVWTGLVIALALVAALLLIRLRMTMARGGYRLTSEG